MDKLWAPWRISYIKNTGKKKERGCLFCRSLKSKKKNYVFIRNRYCFALLNIYPYNNGHVMIAPNKHTGHLDALSNEELTDLFKTIKQVTDLLDKILKPQGYNIGMNIGKCSGAGIPGHLHLHIVPRWDADTNFMPILFNTKIISQSLEDLHKEITKYTL